MDHRSFDDPTDDLRPDEQEPSAEENAELEEAASALEDVISDAETAAGEPEPESPANDWEPAMPEPPDSQIDDPPSRPSAPAVHPVPTEAERQANIAFLVELVGGLIGFLGLGYIYVGRTNEGVVRLVLWLATVGMMWLVIAALSAVLVGLCLIPFGMAVQIGVPILSAFVLKNELDRLAR